MAESKLRNLSVEFSVKIIKLCETIRKMLISSINASKQNTDKNK